MKIESNALRLAGEVPPEGKRLWHPLRMFILLLVLGAVVGVAFLPEIPLQESWRSLIIEEFKKHRIEITLKSVAVSPFEGVVATGVVLYEGAARKKIIAEADRIGLGVDWFKLITKRHFLDMIDLRGGRIEVGTRAIGPLELSGVHARLYLSERQLRVSGFEANLWGVQVTASGTVLNHGEFRLGEGFSGVSEITQDSSKRPFPTLIPSPEVLLKNIAVHGPSRFNIDFSGDLSRPETVEVLGKALLQDVRLGSHKIDRLRCEFRSLGDGQTELRRLEVSDHLGEMEANGLIHPKARRATLQIESGIDLAALFRTVIEIGKAATGAFFPPELKFNGAQRFSAAISANGDKIEAMGHLTASEVIYKHLKISAAGSWFTDGQRLTIRKLLVDDGVGRLSGDLFFSKGQTRASLRSTVNPQIFRPFLSGRARAALDEWKFRDAPELEFEASVNGFDPATLTGSGKVRLGRTIFRGISIREATSNVSYARGAFTYSGLWVGRPEGFVSGQMVYDFAQSEVRFEDVISTVDPQECSVWIDPGIRKDLRAFRFKGTPTLKVNGYAQFGGKTDVDLRIDVNAPTGFDYDIIGKWLPVDSARARLQFTFGRLDIRDLDARTLGGQLRGNIFVSLLPQNKEFGAELDLVDLDFDKFTKLYFNYQGSQGEMRARYKFTAQMDDLATMNGEGTVVVTRGNVFAIPVFGPLSSILNTIIPGIGFSPAKKAFASFNLRNGVAHTKDMEVQGVGFTMLGEGWLDFVRDRMDFNVRINARGVPGVILFPVSKLFEFTSTSALSEPQWRPKRFSIAPRDDRSVGRESPRATPPPKRGRGSSD